VACVLCGVKTRHWLLTVWVLPVYALHQDVWNWRQVEPLLLGMLPVGLWYHLGYSCLAAVTMALLVKFAWPAELEQMEEKPSEPPQS
jgi:hypothetical protein